MPPVAVSIQLLVAPVVMISANGLICLALYNRLAAIVGRLRMFYKERFDTLARLSALPLEEQTELLAQQLRTRVTALEDQSGTILRRARRVRSALVCLLAAVLLMLVCSLGLGASVLFAGAQAVALACFIAGVLAMMAGVGLAIAELAIALEPVTAEGFTLGDRQEP